MYKPVISIFFIIILMVVVSCGPKVLVPPEIDLKEYATVGIMQFRTDAKGKLGEYTSQKFLEEIQTSQKGVQILELGDYKKVLEATKQDEMDIETIKKIGEKYDVNAIILGDLEISDIKPKVNLATIISSMSVRAEVDAKLTVKLCETSKGATVWLNSARDKRTVAQVSIFAGEDIFFDAENPDEAYGELVRSLVRNVSEDLRFRYVRAKR